MTSRLNDKQLILGQIGPTMRVSCAQHHLKNSKGFRPSQNVFYFHLPAFWRGNHKLTIEECLRLLLHPAEVHGQQICQFDKLATYNFWHQFWRNRGMPRTNDKSLPRLGWCLQRLEAWKTASYSGWYKVERVGATGRAELKMVMADTGVNVGTNTGRVNIPEATEETPSLVLALEADAEEIKGCGAPLAEMPRTEEEASEDALPWIDEIMAGMEFPIVQTTASVRESAKWGDQELEAVLDTGLSDVAIDGRESSVGRLTKKLLLVKRDGHGITKDNQKLSSRGRTTTGTTRNNGIENHFDQKKLWQNQEKTLRYSNWKPSQPKLGQNQEKRYATRTPRQLKHNVGTWLLHAPMRHTAGQESAPHAHEQW